MKKVVILSIIFGLICSLGLFINYKNNLKTSNNSVEIYFLQFGAYKNEKSVSNISKDIPYYLVLKEQELFHVYVGISANFENVTKIKEFWDEFGNNIYVSKKKIKCDKFIKDLEKYDYLFSSTNDEKTIHKINQEALMDYEDMCINKKSVSL